MNRISNIPNFEFKNLFHDDPLLADFFQDVLGEHYPDIEPRLTAMGQAAAQAQEFSRKADRRFPELRSYDRFGQEIQSVEYDPSYTALKSLSYGRGILSEKYTPDALGKNLHIRHQTGFSIAFPFAMVETGLFCPICMTDSLGRVIERFGNNELKAQVLPRISSADLDSLWEGAMFLTERQGGSDVGASLVVAREQGSIWRLYGHKWFCSNVDAKAILVLARMPGEENTGTKGLGLFLILRESPNFESQNMKIHRLKDKLGVRSMASGEVTFDGLPAQLIGGMGEGFKMMTEMVNMSRLYNSISSIAVARRALLEAMTYGQSRIAFGQPLTQLPLWRSTMAEIHGETLGLMHLVFETVKRLDQADCGDTFSAALLRLLTPTCKALTGKFVVHATSECMEAIGGNAYIEESIMPRLYRDAQVLPIWEGTTNIQSLDFIRGLKGLDTDDFQNHFQSYPGSAHPIVVEAFAGWTSKLKNFKEASPLERQLQSKKLMEEFGRSMTLCLLASSPSKISQAALEVLSRRQSPIGSWANQSQDHSHLALLVDTFANS